MWFEKSGGLAPGGSLPVVFAFFGGDPRRESLIEISGEREDVGLVHIAELDEARVCGFAVVELETVLCEDVADAAEFGGRKAILR